MAKRLFLVLATAALLSSVLWMVYSIRADELRESGFQSVHKKITRDEVIAILGRPDLERDHCRDRPTREGQEIAQRTCRLELEYVEKMPTGFWTIGFDESLLVISKYHYVSP